MQKKNLVFFITAGILFLSVINLASAYGDSLGDFLNTIESSTISLLVIFIVCFALLNFSLTKFFKKERAIAGIIAFSISLLITYGVNRSDLEFEYQFYQFQNWFQSFGWGGLIFFAGLIAVVIWIVKEERAKSNK